jgi:hypothetical protein
VFKTVTKQNSSPAKTKTISSLLKHRAVAHPEHVTVPDKYTDTGQNSSKLTAQQIIEQVLNHRPNSSNINDINGSTVNTIKSVPITSVEAAVVNSIKVENKLTTSVKQSPSPSQTHELLLRQLKRPSELLTESNVPLKKPKSYQDMHTISAQNTPSTSQTGIVKTEPGHDTASPLTKTVYVKNISVQRGTSPFARSQPSANPPPLSATNPIVQQVNALFCV